MKLNEKQAFNLMHKIENYFRIETTPEERADFVMLELINHKIDK